MSATTNPYFGSDDDFRKHMRKEYLKMGIAMAAVVIWLAVVYYFYH